MTTTPAPRGGLVVRPGGGACRESKVLEPSRLCGADAHRHDFFSAGEPRTFTSLPAAGACTAGPLLSATVEASTRKYLLDDDHVGAAPRLRGSLRRRGLHGSEGPRDGAPAVCDASRRQLSTARVLRDFTALPAAGARTATTLLGGMVAALCDVALRSSPEEDRGKPGIALRCEGSSDGRALHTFGRLTARR